MQQFRLRGSHPLRHRTHHDFDYHCTSTPNRRQTVLIRPTTPGLQPLPGITQTWFSLLRFRSPLLTESLLFSLPAGTEMFHFPAFPPHHLYIQWRVPRHDSWWVSPFGHPRITVWLSTPRGLTQTPTSFVGSSCQGIHRAPFKTYGNTKTLRALQILLTRCSRPLCSSQKTTPHPHHPAKTRKRCKGGPATHPTKDPPEGRPRRGCVQPHNPIACLHLEPTGPFPFQTLKREPYWRNPPAGEVPIH